MSSRSLEVQRDLAAEVGGDHGRILLHLGRGPAEAVALPPLGESDALVRELVGRLSPHPQLAVWLSADQLARRFVVLVVNVMAGENPRPNLRFLEPRERLTVLRRGAATVIDPREANPAVPEPVLAILRQALQRAPEKRFASAAEMGAACEHHLYDKGYGPTNLALKQYLGELFPEAPPPDELDEAAFPELEAELLPIDDGAAPADDDPARTAVRPAPPDHGTLPPR